MPTLLGRSGLSLTKLTHTELSNTQQHNMHGIILWDTSITQWAWSCHSVHCHVRYHHPMRIYALRSSWPLRPGSRGWMRLVKVRFVEEDIYVF